MEALSTPIEFAPGQRVPRDARRRQIIELAGELFAERGYNGASMGELARRAGISKPVIYDLIGSKEDVYRASTERVAIEAGEVIAAAVAQHEDAASQLRAGALAAFRFAAKHGRAAAVLFSSEGSRFADEIGWLRRQRGEMLAALLAAEGARLGREVDPQRLEAVGHMLGGAFEAIALWWNEHPDVDAETLADWFVSLIGPGVESLGA